MEQKLVTIFKALSNEQRMKLFKNIYEWEKMSGKATETETCCPGIEKAFTKACGCMDLSRSTISHHLKELQLAGLVVCTRNGQTISCKINEDAVALIKKFMD